MFMLFGKNIFTYFYRYIYFLVIFLLMGIFSFYMFILHKNILLSCSSGYKTFPSQPIQVRQCPSHTCLNRFNNEGISSNHILSCGTETHSYNIIFTYAPYKWLDECCSHTCTGTPSLSSTTKNLALNSLVRNWSWSIYNCPIPTLCPSVPLLL